MSFGKEGKLQYVLIEQVVFFGAAILLVTKFLQM